MVLPEGVSLSSTGRERRRGELDEEGGEEEGWVWGTDEDTEER